MKMFFVFLMMVPCFSFAHCPVNIEIGGVSYCTDVQWQNGDQKVRATLVPSDKMSPQLVVAGQIPSKWIYSKVQFKIWLDGDHDHIPQKIDNFRIFPYMNMESGHHHSTSHDFSWNSQLEVYELSGLVLQEMPGCWSLRWTTAPTNKFEDSYLLAQLTEYENLSEPQNKHMADYCIDVKADDSGGNSDHGHHHHHH